ncbi:MAG: hypothetical protein HZB33_10970 [Nitrospirae bacterium]|nr:hypothetical protein [Nitrospirota bacterium]
MYADVEIVEGGKLIKKEKMKLKLVKEFKNGIVIYENEGGEAVMYLKNEGRYTLVSIDLA